MVKVLHFLAVVAAAGYPWGLCAQELGKLESFGAAGRLISQGKSDLFLLSRQSYLSEDISGFNGQVRIVKKYDGGGYEELVRDYFATCRAVDQLTGALGVTLTAPEDQTDRYTMSVKVSERRPSEARKGVYNLYWATCFDTFRKFK